MLSIAADAVAQPLALRYAGRGPRALLQRQRRQNAGVCAADSLRPTPSGFPHRAVIERLEQLRARRHVGKAAQPDEAVRIVGVAEFAVQRMPAASWPAT